MGSSALSFGPFRLEERSLTLRRDGVALPVTDRHARVLALLASRAGQVISKDALVSAGWGDVAVTDNSVEQAISTLRRALGPREDGGQYIETVARQGYKFAGEVRRDASRHDDAALEALVAPHRVWLEGRAALETLERDQALAARQSFMQVLATSPDYAPARIGLANACVFGFESTRADESPDVAALAEALHHAHEACRLDPESGEAWATLGFALNRTGKHHDGIAAVRRAVALEPDAWRHHLRLAFVSWGDARLRATADTLRLLPGLGLAHWLAATVHVARQAFDSAERELGAGTAAQDEQRAGAARFRAVGLHWLHGLVRLRARDVSGARMAFERELSFEPAGHLYARECCANTWYALGVLSARSGRRADAVRALDEALKRVRGHVAARAAVAALEGREILGETAGFRRAAPGQDASVDAVLPFAIWSALQNRPEAASGPVFEALSRTPPGAPGSIIPVEPALNASAGGHWDRVLAMIRTRAA